MGSLRKGREMVGALNSHDMVTHAELRPSSRQLRLTVTSCPPKHIQFTQYQLAAGPTG
jgi:hypothetical protein